MTEKAKGGCFCGKVQFEISLPVNRVINCHCNMCRRFSGADYTTWVSVPKASFSLTRGRDDLAEYKVNSETTQTFCRNCSTRITTVSRAYPQVVGLLRGIIADDIDCPVSGNYFVADKAEWLTICNGLPNFGGLSGYEPEPVH